MKNLIVSEIKINAYVDDLDLHYAYDEKDYAIKMPHSYGSQWKISIDANTGIIKDWPQGRVIAETNFKVGDKGSYTFINSDNEIIFEINNDYVPSCLNIEKSYGDYLRFNIFENGKITNWNFKQEDFIDYLNNKQLKNMKNYVGVFAAKYDSSMLSIFFEADESAEDDNLEELAMKEFAESYPEEVKNYRLSGVVSA